MDTVTVNAECYANMLVTFGLPWIDENDPDEETFFQQDGATSHTANILMNLLRHTFPVVESVDMVTFCGLPVH